MDLQLLFAFLYWIGYLINNEYYSVKPCLFQHKQYLLSAFICWFKILSYKELYCYQSTVNYENYNLWTKKWTECPSIWFYIFLAADIAKCVRIIKKSPHARACMDLQLLFAFLDWICYLINNEYYLVKPCIFQHKQY